MADEVQQKVFEFPTNVREAFEQLKRFEKDKKFTDKKIEGLKNFLAKSIPTDQVDDKGHSFGIKEGIKHLTWDQRYTAWKGAAEEIIEKLVPKTRVAEADDIIDGETRQVTKRRFDIVEEGGEPGSI